ncbi:zinc finger, CCHC-type containing protein [Tanacetum coccineum]
MGNENSNRPRTLGDYSRPSYEGYRNAIELPEGAKFFPPRRTAKLRNDILMFQQRQDESLYDTWTRFKDLLQKVPHHGLDLWLRVQIFYDHVNYTTQIAIDYAAGGRLRKLRSEEAWETIEDLAQHEEEEWNNPIFFEKESPDYIDATLEQEL